MFKFLLRILTLYLLILVLFFPISTLIVSSEDEDIDIFYVNDRSTFSIRWIHSVEYEEWEEFFVIKDDDIYLESTRFKTFGAGVPNNVGKDSFLKNGWLYMVGIDRRIGELFIRAGSTTNHRFVFDEKVYVLSKCNEEKPYKFTVKKVFLVRYLIEKINKSKW